MICGLYLIFAIAFAGATPTEQYSRQQIHYVNQMKETSTDTPLPTQNFKRYAVKAAFSDGPANYTLTIYRATYGDMIYFFVLDKLVEADDGSRDAETRAFRVGMDKKTIEEIVSKIKSRVTQLDDGSMRTDYEGTRYASGAYSLETVQPWGRGGSLTETEFVNMNENVGADTTILGAHQSTYSLPITIDAFRSNLPNRMRAIFDNFRVLHLRGDAQRDVVWKSVTVSDVAELAPQKPRPRPVYRERPREVPEIVPDRPWYDRLKGVFR